jgi:hypothetical protein
LRDDTERISRTPDLCSRPRSCQWPIEWPGYAQPAQLFVLETPGCGRFCEVPLGPCGRGAGGGAG